MSDSVDFYYGAPKWSDDVAVSPTDDIVGIANFTGQTQEREEWCWAAVARAINDYYFQRKQGAPPLTQTGYAQRVWGSAPDRDLNRPFPIDCLVNTPTNPHFTTRRQKLPSVDEERVTFMESIIKELRELRPVVLVDRDDEDDFQYDANGREVGHATILTGCVPDDGKYYYWDPEVGGVGSFRYIAEWGNTWKGVFFTSPDLSFSASHQNQS